ncbi:hypothetical protein ABK040_007114 [Willaertia magna]
MSQHHPTTSTDKASDKSTPEILLSEEKLTNIFNFFSTCSLVSLESGKYSSNPSDNEETIRIEKYIKKPSKKSVKRFNKKLGIENDDSGDEDEPVFEEENKKKRKIVEEEEEPKVTSKSSFSFSKLNEGETFDDDDEDSHSKSSLKRPNKARKLISEKLKNQKKLSKKKNGEKLLQDEKLKSAMVKMVKGRDNEDIRVLQANLKKHDHKMKKKIEGQKEKKKEQQQNKSNDKQKKQPKKRAGFEGRSGKINAAKNINKLKTKKKSEQRK